MVKNLRAKTWKHPNLETDRNTPNESKSTNHKSQIMTFWTRCSKRLFPKRSAKKAPSLQVLIDVAENPKSKDVLDIACCVLSKTTVNVWNQSEIGFLRGPQTFIQCFKRE